KRVIRGRIINEPVKTDFYDETFLSMCQLRREHGVWLLSSRANRRRDDEENEEVNEEGNQEENVEEEEDSEKTVEEERAEESTLDDFEWEQVEGEQNITDAEVVGSYTIEESFNVVDEEHTVGEGVTNPAAQPVKQKGKSIARGVDPSRTILDFDLFHLQAEIDRALKANTRF
ncbi:hypothetical protein Dimus_020880, partial [Dionaea muscipula]